MLRWSDTDDVERLCGTADADLAVLRLEHHAVASRAVQRLDGGGFLAIGQRVEGVVEHGVRAAPCDDVELVVPGAQGGDAADVERTSPAPRPGRPREDGRDDHRQSEAGRVRRRSYAGP